MPMSGLPPPAECPPPVHNSISCPPSSGRDCALIDEAQNAERHNSTKDVENTLISLKWILKGPATIQNICTVHHECCYSPRPPSTASICPVIKWGAVAKNMTAAAISVSVPLRCMGVCFAIFLMKPAAAFSPRSIIPGATQFTAISGASAIAMTLVNMCTAAFDEQ